MLPNKVYSHITKITYTIKKYYFTIFHVENDIAKVKEITNTCNVLFINQTYSKIF